MDLARISVGSILPAAIVAARFIVLGAWDNSYTWFFGIAGFLATLVGCGTAVVLLRHRIRRIPLLLVSGLAIAVAAALLTIFPTMWSWPFAGVGFIIAWVLMSGGFMAALLFGFSFRYA